MHVRDRAGNHGVERDERRPARDTAPGAARSWGLGTLQRTIGNAAVVQLLRRAGHEGAEEEQGGHQEGPGARVGAAFQRSSVPTVLRSGGRAMDRATRGDMESRLGADFSAVRIHTGSAARRSAAEIGARAYTSGDHIVLGEGGGDRHTLAHELTHVIQQRQGPVAGTDNGAGLRVSDPSDRFEREAEANAVRVMSGPTGRARTADPEPHPTHSTAVGGGGAAPVQRVETELTLGANTSGRSMAADPEFEAEAMAFERRLAATASAHPLAKGTMGDMATKAKAYIRSGVGGAWDQADERLAEVFKVVGQDDVAKSGFVGTAVADVMAVFDEGTLSERYTHIVRFFTEVLARDLADTTKQREIDQHIKAAKLNERVLRSSRRDMRRAGATRTTVTTRDIAPIPEDSAVEHQAGARVKRNEVLKALHPDEEPGQTGRTEHTVAETGLDFSARQEAVHTKDDPEWNKEQDALKWLAGARVWMINERNSWVEAQRKLSLPLGGGPSGTTNTMMSAAKALDADAYGARLASIAFLIGASHHTLVEIMAAAKPFGCEYDESQDIYRYIYPLTEDELRACGKDGKFPGEAAPAGAAASA
ncbi:DUF4157 domain-containing protein [Streptomyces sp. NPDC057638]|uniref:eCIS core domain-containing protein n=1 Tax=Streptomyces sp. NPDC057638 TaxID=3346190 RepID=UPI0036C2E9D4